MLVQVIKGGLSAFFAWLATILRDSAFLAICCGLLSAVSFVWFVIDIAVHVQVGIKPWLH